MNETSTNSATKKPNLMKRLYNWVLHWAETPYGGAALFIMAFAESSFFPIPPDVLLIALILGVPTKAFKYALNCSIGSVLGGLFGYFIGSVLWYSGTDYSSVANFFFNNIPGFTHEIFESVKEQYDQYGFWIVFTAGFTPIPYKVFTITSGVTEMNLIMFTIASLVSRSARFFLVSWLLWKFGASIKTFIEKYFNILSLVFVALLIGGFVLIKYVI